MDQEIDWAAKAGLDYWAFMTNPKESSLNAVLEQFLSSPKRDQMNLSLITHRTLTLPKDQWILERDRLLRLLRKPGCHTVLGDRPLI